jgi:hypothetical protein
VAASFCCFVAWFQLGTIWPLVTLLVVTGLLWSVFRSAAPLPAAAGGVIALTLCLGCVYPQLGISYMPPDLQEKLGGRVARVFGSIQPSLLSMRLGYSVQRFKPERLEGAKGTPARGEVVFVEQANLKTFLEMVQKQGFRAEEMGRFGTFYSRKAWVRFARSDATLADWKSAWRARSLEALKSKIHYYLVSTQGNS